MTPQRIAVSNRFFQILPNVRQELLDAYPDAEIWFNEGIPKFTDDELVEFIRNAEVAVIGLDRFNDAVLDRLPDLKVITCCSAGVDHIDPAALNKRDIRLGWIPGVNKDSVAELAISLMINLLRKVNLYNTGLRSGDWPAFKMGLQLRGRTVGIHGCGHIGKEVVKLLQPFGVTILASDREDFSDFYAEYGVRAVEPEELWAESEVLTIHLPKNRSTVGMYTEEVLDRLRPGIFLVNTARGGIVDEAGLQARLKDGRIAGAAVDVFAVEPVENPELIGLPNFLATPHIGGSAREAWEAMARGGIRGISENAVPQPGVYPFD